VVVWDVFLPCMRLVQTSALADPDCFTISQFVFVHCSD